MARLLDTADLAPGDRWDALTDTMRQTSGSTRVQLAMEEPGVSGAVDLWSFGRARLFSARTTSISMVRDSRAARTEFPESVAVGVQGIGVGRHDTRAGRRTVRNGDVLAVDLTSPFDFSWHGTGSSTALQVPMAELAMSMDAVRRASRMIPVSPLYRLVSRHLLALTRDADALCQGPSATALGEASIQLARALLASVGGDDAVALETQQQTMLAQVRAYVGQNLRDPALGPDVVAAALAVSRRQLYRICEREGFSLEQYVIDRRLEGAKDELATAAGRNRPIAAVAHRWAFKDTTHFTRRFRAAYGMLPRDWRRVAAEEGARATLEGT